MTTRRGERADRRRENESAAPVSRRSPRRRDDGRWTAALSWGAVDEYREWLRQQDEPSRRR
ncbi:MAG: hypothetical protein ACTHOD_09260 [Motilibacteraceae bacterium]